MKTRTQDEITAEIKALEACKAYAPKYNAFGDNHHRNLDLQIEELRDGIDETSDEFGDYAESQQSAIMEAKYWKECDSDESPSSGWDDRKPKKP